MQKPVIVSRGVFVYPNAKQSISVGRIKTINAVLLAQKEYNSEILIISQKDPNIEEPTTKDIFSIGTLCKITSIEKKDDYEYSVIMKGVKRVLTNDLKIDSIKDCFLASYSELKDTKPNANKLEEKKELLKSMLNNSKFLSEGNEQINDLFNKSSFSINRIVYILADLLNLSHEDRQKIINTNNVIERIDIICHYLTSDSESKKIDQEIMQKVNTDLNKQQREFYLRQKMGAIKEELGQLSANESDIKRLRNKIESSPYPHEIKTRATEELNRMESSINPQENAITRTYLDWLLNIPYWQTTIDNNDITKVEASLDKTHYGLEKVKERITEYLAVRAKSKNSKAPIICLAGPPGVGKSTLAHSIADALGKKFVKMSLGGVHDESEIRGHRRTYIGSMPGRIIKAMKKAEVVNPLFLLDEIDKMTNDRLHGDPASALLEVLDPEQNGHFMDNYIEEPYDLSKVMFVATANYIDQIPEPLLDRLEIIELTSYTEREKLAIAKQHLVPRVINQTGLNEKELKFTDEAITYIINRYTKEAGVRELERLINKIARKFVMKQLHKKLQTQTVGINEVSEYLDKEIFEYNVTEEYNIPGVVNGMAYTTAGGDLLPIEVTYFPGKGDIVITGNLKETMKESASVALDYVKANADKFGLKNFNFKDNDIHIHVPSGGIPKDGPSAGVTLTTAIISALTNQRVRTNLAMTGEITLRGKVLIIGGVKEKVISAFRGGVKEIFLPIDDERYIKDIPVEVREKIKFHLVKTYPEIYEIVFNKK
ncbi:MAG: endopeptidase La [Mycoplasma sp.]